MKKARKIINKISKKVESKAVPVKKGKVRGDPVAKVEW